MTLDSIKRKKELEWFRMTKPEAHESQICISCKQPIYNLLKTVCDIKEYEISGLCSECYNIFTPN